MATTTSAEDHDPSNTHDKVQFSLLKLPNDIIHEICAVMEGTKELALLCRTSKTLYEIGMPHLYRIVTLNPMNMFDVARTLKDRTRLAQSVHELDMDATWQENPAEEREYLLHPDVAEECLRQGYKEDCFPFMFHGILALQLVGYLSSLETLHITLNAGEAFRGQVPPLRRLKTLRLHYNLDCGETIYDWPTEDYEIDWLCQAAPNLSTLTFSSPIVLSDYFLQAFRKLTSLEILARGPIFTKYPSAAGITSLSLAGSCVWFSDVYKLLLVCTQLTTIRCRISYECISYTRNPDDSQWDDDDWDEYGDELSIYAGKYPSRIMRLLNLRRDTLKTIEIGRDYSNSERVYQKVRLNSLREFAKLETLAIPVSFINVGYSTDLRPSNFLDTLPNSIRNLLIFMDNGVVLPQLLKFVEAHGSRRFRYLQSIEIRLPVCDCVGNFRRNSTDIIESFIAHDQLYEDIARVCRNKDIQFLLSLQRKDGVTRKLDMSIIADESDVDESDSEVMD